MNQTKRTAIMQNIRQLFASNKLAPPVGMETLSGQELRKQARQLGILRRRVTFTPLTPQSRAIVYAKAREEYAAWIAKTKPAH